MGHAGSWAEHAPSTGGRGARWGRWEGGCGWRWMSGVCWSWRRVLPCAVLSTVTGTRSGAKAASGGRE
eukprot:3079914-Alexandrium_andersonii.AAC.1